MDKNAHEGKKNWEVYLSLGSNLGDRIKNLGYAIDKINGFAEVISTSHLYESEPWKMNSAHAFINQCIGVMTHMNPESFLTQIKAIEKELGRKRNPNADEYQDRVLDIDILYFVAMIVDTDQLQIPHPQIQNRLFVLQPMNEIASEYLHPILNKTQSELLSNCNDQSRINRM